MYLAASVLGDDGSSEAPLPSDPGMVQRIEASIYSQIADLRASVAEQQRQQTIFSETHGLLAGVIGGAAAGYMGTDDNKARNAMVGGAIGGVAQLAVVALITIIRNATQRT